MEYGPRRSEIEGLKDKRSEGIDDGRTEECPNDDIGRE